MNTETKSTDTPQRERGRALLHNLRELANKLQRQFKETNQHVQSNFCRGTHRSGRKPQLSLTLEGLKLHGVAVEDRRLAHRQLRVLVPIMRKLNAGLQKKDSFEPGKSVTLRNVGLSLFGYAQRSGPLHLTPETCIAAHVLANHSELFTNVVSGTSLQSSCVPLSPPERKMADKSLLFNKIVVTTPLDERELRLLKHLFNRRI